ncbi:MAG: hypothetical protein ACMUIG_09200 [Thermoplasmatota archaeon]
MRCLGRYSLGTAVIFNTMILVISGFLYFSPEVSGQEDPDLGYFSSQLIYNRSRVLGAGVGIGDVDGDGVEDISICDFQGNVLVLKYQTDGTFESQTVWSEPGPASKSKSLNEIKVTDVLLDKPGPEILVGGNSRNLTVVYYEEGWKSEVLYASSAQIWSLGIGEFDSLYPGEEIFLSSFDESTDDRVLRYLKRDGTGGFISEEIPMPHTIKAVDVLDIDSSIPGNEVWVTTSLQMKDPITGDDTTLSLLLEVYHDGSGWKYEEIDRNQGKLIANLEGGDVWSGHDGNELLTVDFDGNCTMYWEGETGFESRVVFRASDKIGNYALLEGMAVGDFNPMNDREEALVTGYYNDVTQIIDGSGEVVPDLVWSKVLDNPNLEISGLNVGDALPDHPGDEIIVGSREGWVEIVYFEFDGFDIGIPSGDIEVLEGTTRDLTMSVIPSGYFTGLVDISVTGGEGLDLTYPRSVVVEDHDPVDFTFSITAPNINTPESEVLIAVKAESGGEIISHSTKIIIRGIGGQYSLNIDPPSGRIYKELGETFIASVSLDDWTDLDMVGIEVTHDPSVYAVCDTPLMKDGSVNLTIIALANATEGKKRVNLMALDNGIPVAEKFVDVTIVTLAGLFTSDIRDAGDSSYSVDIRFLGSDPVSSVTMEVFVGGAMVQSVTSGFSSGDTVTLNFSMRETGEKEVAVVLKNPSGTIFSQHELGTVDYQEDEGGPQILMYVIALIMAIVIIVLIVLALFLAYTALMTIAGTKKSVSGTSQGH